MMMDGIVDREMMRRKNKKDSLGQSYLSTVIGVEIEKEKERRGCLTSMYKTLSLGRR
jgi:hypothetical protein